MGVCARVLENVQIHSTESAACQTDWLYQLCYANAILALVRASVFSFEQTDEYML